MAKGATIMTVLGWDDTALKRGISSATSAVASLGRAISGSVGGAITTMHRLNGAVELVGRAFSGIKSVMDDVLMPAADMEQTVAAFDVLIGSAEESARVLKQLQQLGAKTPFEFPELADAGKKLIAFGESSSEVAKTLRRIGDVSSAVQAPIGEIAEIYGKARVQGTLFAEDINQLTGRGIPVIQQFARQLGVTTGEVKKMASEGKVTFPMLAQAFRDMTGSGGQFAGMMEKQSATFKGMLSNLSDAWTQLKVAFGEPIIQSLKPALDQLINGVGNLKGMAADVGKAIGKWVTYMTEAFQAGEGGKAIMIDLQLGAYRVGEILLQGFKSAVAWVKNEFDPGGMANSVIMGLQGIGAEILPESLGGQKMAEWAAKRAQEQIAKDRIAGAGFGSSIGQLDHERAKLVEKVGFQMEAKRNADTASAELSKIYNLLSGLLTSP